MTLPDDQLLTATCEFVSALLDSAQVSEIGAANWWPRARSALETAAASADTYPHAVSVACRKLQIETLHPKSAARLLGPDSIEDIIGPRLDEWRELAQRDAIYIVGLVQVQRATKRNAKNQPATLDLDMETR